MSYKDSHRQIFLQELYNRAEGDFKLQISMYDIGADIGLGEDEAAAFGQDLFIEGLAEMKTLSGGMGITIKGLESLGIDIIPKNKASCFSLESGSIIDDQGKEAVQKLLNKIRANLDGKAFPFDLMEEIVIDLKTIDVQMLSPNPKAQIIREVFKVIDQNLKGLVTHDIQVELQTIIS